MLEQFSKSFSVLSVVIALGACGGEGGGSTSTSPITPSTPSTPVPLTQAIDINVNTEGLIIPYSVSAPESFLQLADLVVSELELSGQTELTSQSFVDCDNGGGANVDFSDNNNLTDLPYLDIARSVFVGDYLVIAQRLGRNSDGISEYSLIKIPFNRLL